MRQSLKTLLCVLGLLGFCIGFAQVSNYVDPPNYPGAWPDGSWVAYTVDGVAISDPQAGGGSGDGTTGGASPSGSGDVYPCTGGSVFFYRDANNLYFRLCLSSDPYSKNSGPLTSSGSWALLIDVNGDGYRDFVVMVDGKSSQAYDDEPDNIYVLYKDDLRQDFADSDIQIGSGGGATIGDAVLWVQDSAGHPAANSIDGETVAFPTSSPADFKRLRISAAPDAGRHYLDIQVPMAALDASAKGGPRLTETTPMAFAFATANSNTDPVQKDFAYQGDFIVDPANPIPFGDSTTGNTTYTQPSAVSVEVAGCGATTISSEILDTLRVVTSGGSTTFESSVTSAKFYYQFDSDGNDLPDFGGGWTYIGDGALPGGAATNPWSLSWNSSSLAPGTYFVKAIAVDDTNNTTDSTDKVDDPGDNNTGGDTYNPATNETTEIYATFINDCFDFGDAPSGYGDAYHFIPASPTLYLGTTPDGETATQLGGDAGVGADGDDGGGTDDEDGVSTLPILLEGATTYTLPEGTISATGTGTLHAWLDFDGNGAFGTSEYTSVTVTSGTLSGDLTWGGQSTTATTSTYARLRFSSDGSITSSTPSGSATDGEVEDYAVQVESYDYGDAPAVYGDAIHELGSSLYLGTLVDAEAGTQLGGDAGVGADGDDNDGSDDDDGVSSFPTIAASDLSYTLPAANISATGTGTLHAWIDFNGDGSFGALEYTSRSVNSGTLSGDLRWLNLGSLTVAIGDTFVRLRLTSDSGVNSGTPSNSASDGEVEDYPLTIATAHYDYGDAPASYGDAKHVVPDNPVIYLGAVEPDSENTTQADDGADEDGVSLADIALSASSYNALAFCNDHNGTLDLGASVYAWIDFNADGDFADTGEFASASCSDANATSNGTATLNFTGFSMASAAATSYARFRVTTDSLSATDYATEASDGEIEDHTIDLVPFEAINITSATEGNFCGVDATFASGSATDFTDNDITFTGGDDVDGIIFTPSGTYDSVNLSGNSNGSMNFGKPLTNPVLHFYQLDGNSITFNLSAGQSVSLVSSNAGQASDVGTCTPTLSGTTLSGCVMDTSYQNSGLPTPDASNGPGELEAAGTLQFTGEFSSISFTSNTAVGGDNTTRWALGIETCDDVVSAQDYGDAPASYGDAVHGIDSSLRLGSLIDDETATQLGGDAGVGADGDDTDGSDDEDGVVFNSALYTPATTYTIPASDISVTNSSGGPATLHAWLDFDRDGSFDSDEYTSAAVAASASRPSSGLTWSGAGVAGMSAGITYARFRLTSDAGVTASTPGGAANGGEVEDHALLVQDPPTVCDGTGINELSFQNPSLSTGTALQVNAVYRFGDVVPGLDALVTISGFNNGAGLITIDDAINGLPIAFQPHLDLPPTAVPDASVDFNVQLVLSGSSIPYALDRIFASGVDIDGDSGDIREYIELSGYNSYALESPTNLTYVPNPGTGYDGRFEATNATTQPGISADATENIARAVFERVSQFDYRIGAFNAGTSSNDRLNSLFLECASFGDTEDHGDAPTGYGDAVHEVPASATVYLGTVSPDVETEAQQGGDAGLGADGDDGDGVDDEDGVSFGSVLSTGSSSYSVSVDITNGSGSSVTLVGWIDFDGSGSFDADEAASLSGVLAGNQTLTWSSVPADVIAGTTYARFRLSTDALTAGSVVGTASDGEVEDYELTIVLQFVSGTVFYDDGLSSGTAHDGLQNGGELGVVNVTVTATDGTTSVLTVTDANGDYSLTLPDSFGANVIVFHSLQPATGTSIGGATAAACLASSYGDAAAADQVIGDTDCSGAIDGGETGFVTGTSYTDYDFGVLRASRFISDQSGQVSSPGTIEYSHLFTPGTLGSVTLSTSGGLYAHSVFVDENCDGTYSASEGPQTFPYTFTVNNSWPRLSDGRLQECSVKVRVLVPDGEADGTTDTALIEADLTWQTNTAVSDTRFVTDTTVITEGGMLELIKEVRNVTQNTAFSTTGTGKPGEVLEYRIGYTNRGSDQITAVEFSDPVPYFTDVEPNQYGGAGEVELVCPDASVITLDTGAVSIVAVDIMSECGVTQIEAGEGGTVTYRVRIQ